MTRLSSERLALAASRVGLGILFIGLFTFDIWGWGRLFDWLHLRVAADLILFTALGGYLLTALVRKQVLWASPLDVPLTACLAAVAVSALAAREKAGVVEPLLLLAIIVVWLKLLAGGRPSWVREERLLLFLLLASGGFAVRVLLDFVEWYAGTPFSPPEHVSWLSTSSGIIPFAMPYFGLAGGATTVGAYLAMLMPPAAGWLLQTRLGRTGFQPVQRDAIPVYRFWAALLTGWLILAGAAIWLAQSRSGWIAAGSGCLVMAALLLSSGKTANRRLIFLALAVAALTMVVAALAVTVTGRLPSTLTRIFIWGDALRFWMERPLFGWGPGNFVTAQLENRPDASLSSLFWQAHNLPLHLLSVLGGAGLAACSWLLLRAAGVMAAAARAGPLGAGYAGGLAGFLAWNLADARADSFLLWGTATALLALGVQSKTGGAGFHPAQTGWKPVPPGSSDHLSAVALALSPRPLSRTDQQASLPYRALLGLLIAGLGGALLLLERDHLPAHLAGRLAGEERWTEAAAVLERAAGTSTVSEFYGRQVALLQARAGRWEESDRFYRAVEPGRGWAEPLANAAVVAAHAGDAERALGLAARAMELSPLEARYPFLLGELHLEARRDSDAMRFFGIALGLEPSWLASDYWTAPSFAGRLDGVVDAAISWLRTTEEWGGIERAANEGELLLRLGRGQEAEAAALRGLALERKEAVLADEIGLLVQGRVRDPVARERAYFSRGQGPTMLHALLGRIALDRGDIDGAATAFTQSAQAAPAYPPARAGLSVVASARGDHATAVQQASLGVLYGGERAAHAALGRALAAAGRPKEALPHLEAGARATRYYTTWFGLLAYKRREVLPNLLPEVRDLAPDSEIAAVKREIARLGP